MKLYIDNWERNKNNTIQKDVNVFDDVLPYFERINGKETTQIILDNSNNSLTITGNGNNFLAIFTQGIDDKFFNAVNKNCFTDTDLIQINSGGQYVYFQKKFMFDKKLSEQILKYYILKSGMYPEVIWEEDN